MGAKVMALPRDEMAIRKVYEPLVVSGDLKTVFRPGNRVCSEGEDVTRCYWEGEEITVRIVEVPGSDVHEIAPKFSESVMRSVRIFKIENIAFEDLILEHFEGSSPDVQTSEQVAYHLGLVYGRTPDQVMKEGVTRIGLKYLD